VAVFLCCSAGHVNAEPAGGEANCSEQPIVAPQAMGQSSCLCRDGIVRRYEDDESVADEDDGGDEPQKAKRLMHLGPLLLGGKAC